MNNGLDIFTVARTGDRERVAALLEAGADPDALHENGFTALQCAAMGSNNVDNDRILPTARKLIEAGRGLENLPAMAGWGFTSPPNSPGIQHWSGICCKPEHGPTSTVPRKSTSSRMR